MQVFRSWGNLLCRTDNMKSGWLREPESGRELPLPCSTPESTTLGITRFEKPREAPAFYAAGARERLDDADLHARDAEAGARRASPLDG